MEDIIKSIKAFLYERNTSPLFGCFVISTIFLNYKFFIILFSDCKPQVKISLIDQLLNAGVDFFGTFVLTEKYVTFFIYPLLLTIFYIFIYPLLAKPVYEYSQNRQKELRLIKQEVENTKLLSIEESREIRVRLAKITEEYNSETLHYQNQIKALNQRVQELESLDTTTENNETLDSINEEDSSSSYFEEIYDDVVSNIDKISNGEYKIDQLVITSTPLDYQNQSEIAKILLNNIKSRRFKDLRYHEKNNKIIKSDRFEQFLLSDEESILKCFLNDKESSTLSNIVEETGLKSGKVKTLISALRSYKYINIENVSSSSNLNPKYVLLNAGRKYLDENGYFD